MSAFDKQVGGNHYKDTTIQPVQYIHANGLGFMEGCVVKYVTRHGRKGGAEDLSKAIHFLEMLIELEYTGLTPEDQAAIEEIKKLDPLPEQHYMDPPRGCQTSNGNGRPFLHVLRACCNTHELDSERHVVADLLHALHKDNHHDTARTVLGMIGTNNLTDSVKLGPFFRLITEGQVECPSCS